MTEIDSIILVDVYGKPTTPSSGRVFPAYPCIDLTIETERTEADSCPVKWKETQKRNRILEEAALFDLSQYWEDRELVNWARDNKIKIIFDLKETSSHEADGYCDFRKNAIIVKPGINVMRLQYAIIHELQHMFDRANGLVATSDLSMKSGTIVSRALEANANVREALHAWGCEYGIVDGFYKPMKVLETYEAGSNISEIVIAARASAHHLKTGNKDQFCQDVFEAFYHQENQIVFYDEGKLNFLNQYVAKFPGPDAEQLFKRNMSTFMSDDSWTHEKISQKIPFLANALFSLDQPQYYGLSHKVSDEYFEFLKKIDGFKSRSDYRPKCEIPICLFLPDKKISRVLDTSVAPLQQPLAPEWAMINIGNLPAQQPAFQQGPAN